MSQDLEMTNFQNQLALLANKVAEHDQTLLRFAALEERLAAVTAENKTLQQENDDLRARLAEALAAAASQRFPPAPPPYRPTASRPAPARQAPPPLSPLPPLPLPHRCPTEVWSTVAKRGKAKKPVTAKRREAIVAASTLIPANKVMNMCIFIVPVAIPEWRSAETCAFLE
ncbi:hypothetical protein BDF20DRAFT_830856 [Mycotypha africana]|uniref:uncharacterized protein n=1 Tax=Mycotypha africana TaxID=64632 RepID=UPI0023000FCB|nr:uncharacterized protein BDF20DRAFT_830856 [Mycotypha africana]KAI8990750.1 hypothetical protein BDF20DRAFT_830856 [Mycotypha africana]